MVILFDLDGVLLRETTYEPQTRALYGAVEFAHGLPHNYLGPVVLDRHGKTDMQVARELHAATGQGEFEYEITRHAYEFLFSELCPESLEDQLAPFARLALWSLRHHECRLVTGNIKEVALLKARRAGLEYLLDWGRWGYGEMSEDRHAIIQWAASGDQCTYICDTARDIEAGRKVGVKCIAIPSPEVDVETLENADAVYENLWYAAQALR